MTGEDERPSVVTLGSLPAAPDRLPYIIEIWDLPKTGVERIVARADTLTVARAIFTSAVSENPARRLVLRQGERVIEQAG